MFEFVGEAFDEVAAAIEEGAERRWVPASGERWDVGSGSALGELCTQGVAVLGAIGKQHLAFTD